jgi:hypothetical protein
MWHKAQAQPSQGMAGWPHQLGRRPRVGTFQKPVFTTCQSESVNGVSNVGTACKEETWPPGLLCGPHAANLWPQHCLTPPINTTVLPPVESVKRVRFSFL